MVNRLLVVGCGSAGLRLCGELGIPFLALLLGKKLTNRFSSQNPSFFNR